MSDHSRFFKAFVIGLSIVGLAACGGGAAAPASSSAAAVPASSAAAAKPASSAPAASAGASAKPAASSAPASAKPSGSAAAGQLTKVKAAYSQTSAVQGPMYIASDQGFFKQHGLDVSIGQVAGTAQIPAMTANELQFGTPGGNELINSDVGGANIVMIAVSSNYPLFSMFGGKGIDDIKQLAGKSVGITTAGSSTDAAAKVYLKHFGLEKQVKTQPAGSIQGILATLEKGDVAAGVVSPPTTVKATKAGFKELVNGPKLGVPMVHAGITVTRDYLKTHPDVVKAFLQGYIEGWRFAIDPANEAAMVKSIAKWTKTDEATAKASYDYSYQGWVKDKIPAVNPDGLTSIAAVSDNPKAKDAKVSDFYDNSLIEAAAAAK